MYIHLNRQILYYEKSGKGAPLLLLHGNGEDHTIFDKLVPLLEQSYTVYAIDSRGHGESNPTDDFHYDGMADDIAKLISSAQSHMTSGPSSISQAAAVEALTGSQDCVDVS